MMKIAIVCNDTRGGVQPYLALGLGLQSAGHEVRAVAPSEFTAMFAQNGIPMTPLSGGDEVAKLRSVGIEEKGTLATLRFMREHLPRRIADWTLETLDACNGVDVMTGGVGGMVTGLSVADRLGVPFIPTHLQPVGVRTSAYPGLMLPWFPTWLGSAGTRVSHIISDQVALMPFRSAMMKARKNALGLSGKPRAANGQPVIYGFSRYVLPAPTESDAGQHVTGYWNMPARSWQPPAELEDFMAQGGTIVSFGFGSMAGQKPEELSEIVKTAIYRLGIRGIMISGTGTLANTQSTDQMFCINSIPHDWLFPRVHAVVHHGGAGTTGAALQAGVPSVVVPFAVDQPFWAQRVEALGVAGKSIPRRKLNVDNLVASLQQVLGDNKIQQTALRLGEKIRSENGVANAVSFF
jgi:sterol 3beta-glucosyltransferase